MGKYKEFKTFIRKKLNLVGVGELVEDPITANTQRNWNTWFSNPRYIKEYDVESRNRTHCEVINIMSKNFVFDSAVDLLDCGCGTGQFLLEVSKHFPQLNLYGSDFSNESLSISSKKCPKAQVFQMDVYADINSDVKQYDIVSCTEVLEHLLYPDKALRNIVNLVKKGGWLVLTIPNGRKDHYMGHINFWSPESWKIFITQQIPSKQIIFGTFNNSTNCFALCRI